MKTRTAQRGCMAAAVTLVLLQWGAAQAQSTGDTASATPPRRWPESGTHRRHGHHRRHVQNEVEQFRQQHGTRHHPAQRAHQRRRSPALGAGLAGRVLGRRRQCQHHRARPAHFRRRRALCADPGRRLAGAAVRRLQLHHARQLRENRFHAGPPGSGARRFGLHPGHQFAGRHHQFHQQEWQGAGWQRGHQPWPGLRPDARGLRLRRADFRAHALLHRRLLAHGRRHPPQWRQQRKGRPDPRQCHA